MKITGVNEAYIFMLMEKVRGAEASSVALWQAGRGGCGRRTEPAATRTRMALVCRLKW